MGLFKAWCCIQWKPAERWLRTLQLRGVPRATWAKALEAFCEATEGGSTWSRPENTCPLCPHQKAFEGA